MMPHYLTANIDLLPRRPALKKLQDVENRAIVP